MFPIFPELQDVDVIRVHLTEFQAELHPKLLVLQYNKSSMLKGRNGSLVNLLSIYQINFSWKHLDELAHFSFFCLGLNSSKRLFKC